MTQNRLDLHPDYVTHNLAVEHLEGILKGQRTVHGKDWILRHLTVIYVLFINGQTTSVTLEKDIGDNPFVVRYTLTDDEPDLP